MSPSLPVAFLVLRNPHPTKTKIWTDETASSRPFNGSVLLFAHLRRNRRALERMSFGGASGEMTWYYSGTFGGDLHDSTILWDTKLSWIMGLTVIVRCDLKQMAKSKKKGDFTRSIKHHRNMLLLWQSGAQHYIIKQYIYELQ